MGGNLSTPPLETTSLVTALVVANGSQRQKFLKDLAARHREAEEEDFYALFGLERYAKMDAANTRALALAFVSLIRCWHPDKNPAAQKETCEVHTAKLYLARRVLLTPDLKRRYDLELHRQCEANGGWSTVLWYCRWGWNVVQMMGGLTAIVCGAAGLLATGGLGVALTVSGSMALTAGIRGSAKMAEDPDCSTTEYVKDLGVGALQGAAGGLIGAAPAAAGASAAVQVGRVALCGAGMYGSGHVISDASDVLISGGHLGRHLQENVAGGRTTDEIFSLDNARKLLAGCALGPFLGPLVQGAPREVRVSPETVSL